MEFKAGDRVHVTRLNGEKVDFYATLKETRADGVFCLIDCTYHRYETVQVYTPKTKYFGPDETDYYTLATDEEDTEGPEVQHVNDKFSFARSKNYDIQEYIQEGNNLNIAKNMKEGCVMPTIKTKKEMNERELIKYLLDHESTNIYSSGISIDGAWISIEPEIESKVDFQLKEVFTDGKIYTVETEEEITEDTVLPKILEIANDGCSGYATLHERTAINEVVRKSSIAFYFLNEDLSLTLIWTKEKGLVE